MKHILCQFIESQTWPSIYQNRALLIQTQTLFPWHAPKVETKLLILYAKQPMDNHRAPTHDKNSH
jgi:hypothetical protein